MENKKSFKAVGRYLPSSPLKVRPVANLVRNKPYVEALAILEALPQKGARLIQQVVESAAANAMNLHKKLDEEQLVISQLYVDDGPRMKRVWPRSHGRRDILLKRQCHITVVLDEKVGN
ncbi:MAG: 50S ribosomal protein L22 [Sphaerochaetaceae bacterium]|jgi:large subunit ribosomal protein L22